MALNISCDTESKEKNRQLYENFIGKHFSPKKRKNAKVLFLPGHEGLELDVYDRLGFKRSNLYAVTNEKDDFEKIKHLRGVNCFLGELFSSDIANKTDDLKHDIIKRNMNFKYNLEYYQKLKLHQRLEIISFFDIIYFDLYSNAKKEIFDWIKLYPHMLKNNGIFGITLYGTREKYDAFKNVVNNICNAGAVTEKATAKLMTVISVLWHVFVFDVYLIYLKHGKVASINYIRALQETLKNGFIDNDLYLEIRKYAKLGSYPVDALATKYYGNGNAPMLSVFMKFRKCAHLSPIKFVEKIFSSLDIIENLKVHEITRSKTQSPIKKSDNANNSKPVDSIKQAAIDWLKYSPNETKTIAELTGLSVGQVRAIKAHMTMGTYQ